MNIPRISRGPGDRGGISRWHWPASRVIDQDRRVRDSRRHDRSRGSSARPERAVHELDRQAARRGLRISFSGPGDDVSCNGSRSRRLVAGSCAGIVARWRPDVTHPHGTGAVEISEELIPRGGRRRNRLGRHGGRGARRRGCRSRSGRGKWSRRGAGPRGRRHRGEGRPENGWLEIATQRPTIAPAISRHAPWRRAVHKMRARVAPKAARMPNSRVRRLTA